MELLLLEYRANIHTFERDGYSVLHFSAKYRRLEINKLLLEHGANTVAVDEDGQTAVSRRHKRR